MSTPSDPAGEIGQAARDALMDAVREIGEHHGLESICMFAFTGQGNAVMLIPWGHKPEAMHGALRFGDAVLRTMFPGAQPSEPYRHSGGQ